MKDCRLYARVLQTDDHVESTFLLIIIIIIIIIINIIKIIINIIIINISLIKCLLGQKILLFIFNPCISLQLISPCANFFFFFSLQLFLSCHLTLFLSIFRFCVPVEISEGFWFSSISRGHGMGVLVIFGSINDYLIWCFQFMPFGGAGEHAVLGYFGGYQIGTSARDG